jgi:hypothetical protein
MHSLSHEALLTVLVGKIRAATERLGDGGAEEDLPTSASLARALDLRLENVKKKLRILKENEIIQVVGITPKRYRFNPWILKTMDDDHPFHFLFEETETENEWDDW